MPWLSFDILLALPVYALVLFRISGLMLTAPIFASRIIPLRIRGALVIVLAAMMFPLLRSQAPAGLTLTMALLGGVSELMIGVIIGLSLSIFIMAAEVAGTIVGQQAGLALSRVVDPTQGQQTSVMGQLYTLTLMLLFLHVGGHRATMAALLDTYEVIPLLSFRVDESAVLLLIELLTAAFMLGIRLAGPVLIALFLTGTSLGFLSRTMPQLNILTVGFTLRTLTALAVAGVALSASQDTLVNAIFDALGTVRMSFGLDPEPMEWTD